MKEGLFSTRIQRYGHLYYLKYANLIIFQRDDHSCSCFHIRRLLMRENER